MSSKALFNIEKRKTITALIKISKHNNRTEIPANSRPEKLEDNIYCDTDTINMHSEIMENITKARAKAGAKKLMKNSVKAVELTLGLSQEKMLTLTKEQRAIWHTEQTEWAKDYFKDKGTLIQSDFHEDESNPHTHLIFIPNTIKMDNKTGKMLPTLDAKGFVGNVKDMKDMRQSHWKANEKYGVIKGGQFTNPEYKPSGEYIKSIDDFRRATHDAQEQLREIQSQLREIQSQLDIYNELPIEQLFNWFNSIDFDRELLSRPDYTTMLKEAKEAKESNDKSRLMKVVNRRLDVSRLSQ